MSPNELMQEWEAMNVEAGLGEWREQIFASYATQGTYLQYLAYGLFGLAIIGALMLLGSFFIRGS